MKLHLRKVLGGTDESHTGAGRMLARVLLLAVVLVGVSAPTEADALRPSLVAETVVLDVVPETGLEAEEACEEKKASDASLTRGADRAGARTGAVRMDQPAVPPPEA